MDLKAKNKILIGEGFVWHSRPNISIQKESFLRKIRKFFNLSNSFSYPIFNLLIPIHEECALSSLEKGLFISLSSKDYLKSKNSSLKKEFLDFIQTELDYTCDKVWLQTLPRMFGYTFNPVSFWYCYKDGNLDAVLCEVNNTFGDRHFYFIEDLGSTHAKSHLARKTFHVSPFLDIKGHYNFKFLESEKENEVRIQLFENSELKIDTKIKLKYQLFENISSFYIFKKFGWMTIMVILRIHMQAIILWIKGAIFFRRPSPPKEQITYEFTEYKQSSSI